ncbi:acetate--CoA ligase family protein [Chelativorans sp. YIM 93263]|uniref:acetate--CoA ligase family protein n=1 Tax=Chelativorans sp. YIM 93263 TaxID=2906648 RepID=UPI00403D7769
MKLGIESRDQAMQAYNAILAAAAEKAPKADVHGVLVSRQLGGGVECFMGIKRDPSFGPVAVFGLGGIYVEILNDVAIRPCPFTPAEARSMIESIKGASILYGARGQSPVDIGALAEMLSKLSCCAARTRKRGAGRSLKSARRNSREHEHVHPDARTL